MQLVLLDRDGVINEDLAESVRCPDEFRLIPGVDAAIAKLNRASYAVALVTNQAVVGRHHITLAMLDRIHAKMLAALSRAGGRVDRIYVATDTPEYATLRRKPGPGMLQEAIRDFCAIADRTVMIGDDLKDLRAALAAGCKPLLVQTGKGPLCLDEAKKSIEGLVVRQDLAAAVTFILEKSP
ncbi:MAG: HAD-IIIA family hydrolase [Alphaproteobacteria bacterium]